MEALVAVVIFAVSQVCTNAATSDTITLKEAVRDHLLLFHPRPDYPDEARRRGIVGMADFELTFDYETGHLREVHLAKSSGSPLLDAAAIAALKQWKAKPRSIHRLLVPLGFATREHWP